jgi:hypothetical protein
MELSTMRLSSKYTGGPCKFLQNFQEKYQDLEDTTQSVVPDHEKIGQLSACVRDYADFSSIVNDMTRTAKQLKSSLSFADVMEELTTKAEDLKEVQKRRVNSTMVSKSGQGGRGTGQNSGGCGGKSGRGKGKPSNVLTREEYFALTPQEKQELKSDRASFLQKYRQRQRQSGGNAGTSRTGVPTMINATTTAERTGVTTSNNNGDDQTTITTPTIRSIFATSTARQHQVDATTVHTDPDGTRYSIRRLNANRVIRVSPMQTDERIIDGLIDGGSNNGLAGEAMRLWGESVDSQRVDVIGCTDNIEMINLSIGTYHTVLTASTGERVIGVFHNMVGYGKGKSIICPDQCESHGLKVSRKARRFGGTQKIITPDGYVFKYRYQGGLLYLPMEYPTDEEIDKLIHVEMTSPLKWNPDELRDTDDDEEWFKAIETIDPDAIDYDEFYSVHPYVGDGDIAGAEAEDLLLQVFVNPTRSRRKNRDWPNLRKYFAWKPWEVIRDTFQVTTQYAV